MKTITPPAVITPSILGLALLAAAVVFIGATGRKVPVLSNVRVDIILLVILGMMMCTQSGIGRIAATGEWSHPLSIVGYILGGTILLIAASVFMGWKLPFLQNDQQALIAIAILVVAQHVGHLPVAVGDPSVGAHHRMSDDLDAHPVSTGT